MGRITEAMLKRRAEHNEGILHSLEELVLQEEGIDKIDKTLGKLCPHLKIVYMPNNLIPRIENLHRLKGLQYLNLTLNNIRKIEGLEQCEFLQKLDLTLNFVDKAELNSVSNLSRNVHLRELFLTGNPCQDFDGYRYYVIASLPHLKRLDAVDVKPSERIRAEQEFKNIKKQLENHDIISEEPNDFEERNADGQVLRNFSPATRLAEHAERITLENEEKPKVDTSQEGKPGRRKGFDPFPTEGRIFQKNEGGWKFRLIDSDLDSKILLDVPVGRYMDTSLIDVDIQPLWVRVLVKGKLLQLQLPEEVKVDASTAQRSNTTGNLLIIMPKASKNGQITLNSSKLAPSMFYTSNGLQSRHEKEKSKHSNESEENRRISRSDLCTIVANKDSISRLPKQGNVEANSLMRFNKVDPTNEAEEWAPPDLPPLE